MLNKLRIFKENVQVSGYNIPADFFMPTQSFLDEISTLSSNEKLIKLYENISGEKVCEETKNKILNIENLFEILCADDDVFMVDLSQNKSLSYTSLIIDNSTIYRKICSFLALYFLVYLDLFEAYLDEKERVVFILPFNCKMACLSALIFKKFVNNITFIIAGDDKVNSIDKKGFFKPSFDKEESQNFILEFFEDYGYVFDQNSSKEIFAYESFLQNYDANFSAVFFAFLSPYLTCQESYTEITGKYINNKGLAIKKFYEETALEIPENLSNGEFETSFKNDLSNEEFIYHLNNLL